MVQFLSIIFFSWISSIFVRFFKSSRFLCHSVSFFYHVLPDIQSGQSRLTAESLLNGENTPSRHSVAVTAAKRKAKVGIGE